MTYSEYIRYSHWSSDPPVSIGSILVAVIVITTLPIARKVVPF